MDHCLLSDTDSSLVFLYSLQALEKSQLGEVVRNKDQKLDTPGMFSVGLD